MVVEVRLKTQGPKCPYCGIVAIQLLDIPGKEKKRL